MADSTTSGKGLTGRMNRCTSYIAADVISSVYIVTLFPVIEGLVDGLIDRNVVFVVLCTAAYMLLYTCSRVDVPTLSDSRLPSNYCGTSFREYNLQPCVFVS